MLQQSETMLKSKEKLKKSAYALTAAFFCTIGIAFAWFFTTERVQTDTAQLVTATAIHCVAAVSAENTEFYKDYSKLTSADFSENASLSGLKIGNAVELSGLGYRTSGTDGALQLYQISGYVDGTPIVEQSQVVANKDYLDMDVYLKSNLAGVVYLNPESNVTPVDPDGTGNKSTYGKFSKDYLAAATRVSVSEVVAADSGSSGAEETPGTEQLKLLWAPLKSVQLIAPDSEEAVTGWKLKTNGTVEEYYSYCDGSIICTIKTDDYSGMTAAEGACFYNELPSEGVLVGTLSEQSNQDGTTEYVCHLKIRVWVEATDREAKAALSGGQFTMGFTFESVAE